MGWGRAVAAAFLLFLAFVLALGLVPSKLYQVLASAGASSNVAHLAATAWEVAWLVLLSASVPLLQRRGWI
jgi:hypothetical protein